MKLADILYLNPNYFIRHDETRSLLWARDTPVPDVPYSLPFHSFIHPYHAELLSLFDGTNTIKDVIGKSQIGKLYGLKTLNFIEQITENTKGFSVGKKEYKSVLPINLLLTQKPPSYQYSANKSDFSFKQLDFHTQRLNFPLYITYMINTICYTDCIYCYADCRTRQKRQLPLKKIMELLDEIEKHPILDFTIMGGEFFLDEEWEKILIRLKELKLTPTISTKVPLSEDVIRKLKSIGINNIQISLDSVNPAILSKLLNIKGDKYLSDMMNCFYTLEQMGIKVKINSVITRYNCNINEIENLFDFLSQYSIVNNIALIPAGFSLYKPTGYMPTETAIDLIEQRLEKIKSNYSFPIHISRGLPQKHIINTPKEKHKYFSKRLMCSGNRWQAYIMPNGDVSFCEGTMSQKEFTIGNIREKKFSDVWKNGNAPYLLDISNYEHTICGTCNEFEECHTKQGVCWKFIRIGYGKENVYMPDPRCPKSPKIINHLYQPQL